MHYEIMFDDSEPFLTGRMFGELSADGHQLFLRDLLAHPRWKSGMNVLIDNRAASLANVTLSDLQRVSLMVKNLKDALGSGGRCAIVLSSDAEFTKIAMWKVLTAPEVGFQIEFFDSIEEAKNWLH